MNLRDIIDARGYGAFANFCREINRVEGREIGNGTFQGWVNRCRVEECGDIYLKASGKFISNMNLTPEESERCKQFSA